MTSLPKLHGATMNNVRFPATGCYEQGCGKEPHLKERVLCLIEGSGRL